MVITCVADSKHLCLSYSQHVVAYWESQDRNEYMYILDEEEQELASSDTVSRDSQSLAVITLVQDLLHEAAAKAHNSRYYM
jgi:hypothetical protein